MRNCSPSQDTSSLTWVTGLLLQGHSSTQPLGPLTARALPRASTRTRSSLPVRITGSMPLYDDNCHLWKHLIASNNPYFEGVGLPVNVFHFKSKHTQSDNFCQTHCNPAWFQGLVGNNNKWVFNSSGAEQANIWFGKFRSVVREMPVVK